MTAVGLFQVFLCFSCFTFFSPQLGPRFPTNLEKIPHQLGEDSLFDSYFLHVGVSNQLFL